MEVPDFIGAVFNAISSAIKLASTGIEYGLKRKTSMGNQDKQSLDFRQFEVGVSSESGEGANIREERTNAGSFSRSPFGRFDNDAPVGSKEWLAKSVAEAEYVGEELEIEVASRKVVYGRSPGPQPHPVCYAALLFLSNASSTSLSTLASPPGSSGRGSLS